MLMLIDVRLTRSKKDGGRKAAYLQVDEGGWRVLIQKNSKDRTWLECMTYVSLAFPKSVPIVSAFVANNSVHIAGDFLLHFEVRIDWIRFGLSVGLTFGKGSMSAVIRPSWKMTSKVELGLFVSNCQYMCHIRRFDCHMFRQQQRLAVRYYMSFWEQLTAQHVGALCRKPFRNSFPTGKFWPYWKKWFCWQIFRLSRCSTAPGWSNAYTKVASTEPRDKCHAFCRCPSTLTAAIELSNYASRLSLYMVSMEKESCSKKSSHLAAFSAAFFPFVKRHG